MAPKAERGILPRISPHVESGDKIDITYTVFEKKCTKITIDVKLIRVKAYEVSS